MGLLFECKRVHSLQAYSMCGTVVRVSQGTQSSGIEHVWDCCLSVRGYAVFRHTACVGLLFECKRVHSLQA